MKSSGLSVLAAIAFLVSATPLAAATFFTDRAAFTAATTALTIEDFRDTSLVSGLSISSTNGRVQGNRWNDTVARPLLGVLGGAQTTFNFSTSKIAFGGDFNLSSGGLDAGIQFVLDGVTVLGTQLAQSGLTFFGFIADNPFTSVTLRGGTRGGLLTTTERYRLDDVSFAEAPPPISTVPLPASIMMLLAGLVAMTGLRHFRRKAAATA